MDIIMKMIMSVSKNMSKYRYECEYKTFDLGKPPCY